MPDEITREEIIEKHDPAFVADALKIDVQTGIALLSALVHAEELLTYVRPTDPGQLAAYEADLGAFRNVMDQVRPIMATYDKMALLPSRRDGVRYKDKA